MSSRPRLVIHETKDRRRATQEAAERSGLTPETIRSQLVDLNDRIKVLFGYESDPIEVGESGTWRIDGVAGLLRLNDQLELEIVPKFLDPLDENWRTDFFLLAVLVRTGHLLLAEEISAGLKDRGDLATLVARALLRLHDENQRRPIRGYKRNTHVDFSFDGDIDWDTLMLPEADGFRLQRLELTQRNIHNAVLKTALDALIPEVGEGDTRAQLQRLARSFGNQPSLSGSALPLPARHRSWDQAYSLSQFVLDGMSLDLNAGSLRGLGFVISTWEAWQLLCEEVARRALPRFRTVPQQPFKLGLRTGQGEKVKVVEARPDLAVLDGKGARLLLDAKYKTRQGRNPAISSADLYEGLAFLRAAEVKRIILLYPALEAEEVLRLGDWKYFDQVSVDDMNIQAAQIQVRGLSRRGGFDQLVRGARSELESMTELQ